MEAIKQFCGPSERAMSLFKWFTIPLKTTSSNTSLYCCLLWKGNRLRYLTKYLNHWCVLATPRKDTRTHTFMEVIPRQWNTHMIHPDNTIIIIFIMLFPPVLSFESSLFLRARNFRDNKCPGVWGELVSGDLMQGWNFLSTTDVQRVVKARPETYMYICV